MIRHFLILFLLYSTSLFAQQNYWQQEVHYTITTELNDKDNTLTSFESMVYKNNSPSTLTYIWFHIWPNAYKNDSTALFEQIRNDPDSRNKSLKHTPGFISDLSFKVNDVPASTEPHPNPRYIDIIKLLLPQPLKPGDSVTISTPFTVKLPEYFSRSGYADGEFMICQWYPKPAVYDKNGWHEFPYLEMGEFYSEYGSYNVKITLPSEYVVGATGNLQTGNELSLYKKIGSKNIRDRNGKPELYRPPGKAAKKTLRYHADKVPDFAWFADKDFVIQYDTIKLQSGKVIDAFTYYHNKPVTLWKKSLDYVKDGLKHYSTWIGEYDYPVVQAVEGPENNSSGGMEYPMITLITSPGANEEKLDAVITHEVGHNWFMSMLGSNERAHTWMDEGLNTYFQFRYEAQKYRANSIFGEFLPVTLKALPLDEFEARIYRALQDVPMEAAIENPADKFKSSQEYSLVSYIKTAIWMFILESGVGQDKVDAAFHNYFREWKFKHPQPEDLKASFEEATGTNLDPFFKLLNKTGKLE